MKRWDADQESVAETPDLAALAALLADRTRAAICMALLDGGTWTAGELAEFAAVAPSTTTEHLNLLVSGGLLAEERQGRRRSYGWPGRRPRKSWRTSPVWPPTAGSRSAPWPRPITAGPCTTPARATTTSPVRSASPSPRR